MTYAEFKRERQKIRCIYKGITDPYIAFSKNHSRINRYWGATKIGHYLLAYNAELRAKHEGRA